MGELCIWHKSFPSAISARIDDYLSGGFKPSLSGNRKNVFLTFDLEFNDKDFDDTITIKTGDDIAITTNADGDEIKENRYAGKVSEYSSQILAMEPYDPETGESRKILKHSVTVEQRDFSSKPFPIDNKFVINLSDLLPLILQEYTRTDLGGTINGVVIPKYRLDCEDIELANYTFTGIAKDHLIEAVINRAGKKWRLELFSESDVTNGINYCYQVVVYD